MTNKRLEIRVDNHTYFSYPDESAEQFADRVKKECGLDKLDDLAKRWFQVQDMINKLNEIPKSWSEPLKFPGIEHNGEEYESVPITFSHRTIRSYAGEKVEIKFDDMNVYPDFDKAKHALAQPDSYMKYSSEEVQLMEKTGIYPADFVNGNATVEGTVMMTRGGGYPYNYGADFFLDENGDGEELEEDIEEEEKPLDEEFEFIKVKEIQKIKLDPQEALIIKLPAETSYEEAQRTYEYVVQTLKTDRVLVFVGDVEFTKADFSAHAPTKKHELYDK